VDDLRPRYSKLGLRHLFVTGLGLSGGQRARVSLARAVYSRASTLLLDDIISALDAHTTKAIITDCFQGEIMKGRTVILVSHAIKMIVPVAAHVVLLENGDLKFSGNADAFVAAGHLQEFDDSPDQKESLIEDRQSSMDATEKAAVPHQSAMQSEKLQELSSGESHSAPKKAPRKLVEDEARSTGGIALKTWKVYFRAQGSLLFWAGFIVVILIGACPPLWENLILNKWSASYVDRHPAHSPTYFIVLYALATIIGTVVSPHYRRR
jgi:ATPase subunit of ABC transporter with duplicated ATPase domains